MVLHSYVLLVLAGVLMELTFVAVVFSIAATHRLLGFAFAAEGAHAFSWQAIWRLDTRAAVAAGHLGAGVFQRCREGQTLKQGLVKGCHFYCTLESNRDDRPPYLSGCWCTLGGSVQQQLFWAWRTTWHPWVLTALAVYSYKQVAFHFQHELIQGLCMRNTFCIAMPGHALIATSEKRSSEYLPFPQMLPGGRRENRREVCFPPWICFHSN